MGGGGKAWTVFQTKRSPRVRKVRNFLIHPKGNQGIALCPRGRAIAAFALVWLFSKTGGKGKKRTDKSRQRGEKTPGRRTDQSQKKWELQNGEIREGGKEGGRMGKRRKGRGAKEGTGGYRGAKVGAKGEGDERGEGWVRWRGGGEVGGRRV